MSETFSNLVNWENLNKHKDTFQTQKPFNFVFIENFFAQEFYDSLYRTYPKIDETWGVNSDHSKSQYYKTWNNKSTNTPSTIGDDTTLSDSWNKLKRYAESNEFIENFNKFQNPFRRPIAMTAFLFGTVFTIYLGIGACLPIDKSLTLGLF